MIVRLGVACGVALLVANCSQQTQTRRMSSQESREIGAFPQRKFGAASPRVVADGQAVPKGGGRDHVGRSYTIAGKRYTPYEKPVGYIITGAASWYGPAFHGRKTANGEVYDRFGVSAAHPTMPLPSYARVTNLGNRRSIVVRVNDRGPYHGGRVIDLSQKTAELLDFRHLGTARVRVEYIGRASLAGSDDRRLVASLTTDGTPATAPGMSQPATMIANAPPLTSPRVFPATGVTRDEPETPVVRSPALAVAAQNPAPAAAASALSPSPSSADPTPRTVRDAPVPPGRPFDLATIAGAATPIAFAGAPPARLAAVRTTVSEPRPVVASLYFAESAQPQAFSRNHPLARDLKPQRFEPLTRR
jgi:rare lipoprotein A